jgi:hypothetical protein
MNSTILVHEQFIIFFFPSRISSLNERTIAAMEDRIEQAKQTKNSRFYLGQARRSAHGSGEGAAQGGGEARTGAGAVGGTRRRSGGRARDAAHRGWDRRERRVRRGLPVAGRTASGGGRCRGRQAEGGARSGRKKRCRRGTRPPAAAASRRGREIGQRKEETRWKRR